MKYIISGTLVFLFFIGYSCKNNQMILTGNQEVLRHFKLPSEDWDINQSNEAKEPIYTFDQGVYSIFIIEKTELSEGISLNRESKKTYTRRSFEIIDKQCVAGEKGFFLESGFENRFSVRLREIFKKSCIPKNSSTEKVIEVISLLFLDENRVIYHSTNRQFQRSKKKAKSDRPKKEDYKDIKTFKHQEHEWILENVAKPFEDKFDLLHDDNWFKNNMARGYYFVLGAEKDSIQFVFETKNGNQFELFGKIKHNNIQISKMTNDEWSINDMEYESKIIPISEIFKMNQPMLNFRFKETDLDGIPLIDFSCEGNRLVKITKEDNKWVYIHEDGTSTKKDLYSPW